MEQLTNLVISDRELAIISTALNKLMNDTNATSVMLIDKSGQVIATQGTGVRRNATSLGALLAGAFSSSRHIAELLGEKDFRTIFQQGVHENIYTTMVEEQWLWSECEPTLRAPNPRSLMCNFVPRSKIPSICFSAIRGCSTYGAHQYSFP